MREIKFRAWHKELGMSEPFSFNCLFDKEPQVIMLYIGLKDNNGKEMYEGDIVRYQDEDFEEELADWHISVIEWCGDSDYPAFDIKDHFYECNAISHLICSGKIEVIGNIYENPKLIESEVL